MIYLLDTNVILFNFLNPSFESYFNATFRPNENLLAISVVTEGELDSIAIQRNWGIRKKNLLADIVKEYVSYPIKVNSVIKRYAEIDAYSQNKLPDKPLGMSSRNMGKNDLWIAATASVVGATLITTDKDFQHLDGAYLDLKLIDIAAF
ncbi:MAG: PIN domain-containing protein [Chitinophagales bacterium]